MFIKTIRYAVVFTCIASGLHSEYLVYELTDDKVSSPQQADYPKIFNTLMTYQFPMSQMQFTNFDKLEGSEKEELDLLLKNEQSFLQNKLSEIDKNLQVAFIPTALYELMYLLFSVDDVISGNQYSDNILTTATLEYSPEATSFETFGGHISSDRLKFYKEKGKNESYSEFYKRIHFPLGGRHIMLEYYKTLKDAGVLKPINQVFGESWDREQFFKAAKDLNAAAAHLHQRLNGRIVTYKNDKKLWNDDNAEKVTQAVFSDIDSFLKDEENGNHKLKVLLEYSVRKFNEIVDRNFFDAALLNVNEIKSLGQTLLRLKDEKNRQLVTNSIKAEIDAHDNNQYLVYRGTTPYDFEAGIIEDPQAYRSISFGNSLFADLLWSRVKGNNEDSMPFSFMISQPFGFALKINVADYLRKGESFTFFNIPPYATLVDMCLQGEDTHVRTKVYQEPNKLEHTVGRFPKIGTLDARYLLSPAIKKDWGTEEFEKRLGAFINNKKDYVVLKNEVSEPSPDTVFNTRAIFKAYEGEYPAYAKKLLKKSLGYLGKFSVMETKRHIVPLLDTASLLKVLTPFNIILKYIENNDFGEASEFAKSLLNKNMISYDNKSIEKLKTMLK